ncbi:uncharacterized protein LOC141820949 [Curcuma longa]|uniref:uncharacterized protein LOC141820949 n=1 Tax=Curcuma longa TaxID=136217 RepID=UPI003D9E5262
MDGVAGRLGRSSTRYGPASVFSGPVRRWNKKWVALSGTDHRRRSSSGGVGGHQSSHLLLYRWTPVSALSKDAATPPPEEPPSRKFRYVPISVSRERKEEASPKSNDTHDVTDEFHRKGQVDHSGTNHDMNNISAEVKASSKDQTSPELGNTADLDLSLGLRAPNGDLKDESKTTKQGEGYTKTVRASSTQDTDTKVTKSTVQNKLKRKAINPDLEMAV